jgi:hypothetical protein
MIFKLGHVASTGLVIVIDELERTDWKQLYIIQGVTSVFAWTY